MAEQHREAPGLGRAAGLWARGAASLACAALLLAGCLGGPHPVPPVRDSNSTPVISNPGQTPTAGTGSMSVADNPSGSFGTAAGAGAPVIAPPTTPQQSSAAGSGGAPADTSGPAAGTTGSAASAGTGAETPSSNAPGTAGSGDDGCHGALSLATGTPNDNVLFLVDRSADMASDFQGQPRWQQSDRALVSAITPLTAATLKIGALFYPSSASAAPACVGPSWLCPAAASTSDTTCGVSAMGANDQVALQPVAQALTALSGSMLFQPIDGSGVPLRESIERVNTAIGFQPIVGRTSVVLLANAQPSCRWDRTQASSMLSGWRTQHSIPTHVIALPGANPAGMTELSALASAGGQTAVLTPTNAAALQSELQSIALGSLSSCMLTLDPPVTTPQDAHVIVGVHGVEEEMPRTDANGAALWTLSADGKQLSLLGGLCSAAQRGDYDSLNVRVGCVHFPQASLPGAP
jgi:hypothetical protein